MLVTIGLTTYNSADTVRAAIESALAQDWNPLEVVIVDDASTDGTRAILEECRSRDQRIRLFFQQINSGVAAARNVIIEKAAGEFIAFFDDDDASAPTRVRKQVKRLTDYEIRFARGAHVVCHTARRQLFGDGTSRIERTMGEAQVRPAPSGRAAADRVLSGAYVRDGYGSCGAGSMLARTSTLHAFHGYDPAFRRCEDTDLFIRMAQAGAHFVGIAEPLVTQTMTKTSDKSLALVHHYQVALFEKHRDFFVDEGEYRFSRDWVDMKYSMRRGRRAAFGARLLWLAIRFPIRTFRRLLAARWNIEGNRAQSRFYSDEKTWTAPPS